ncbi:Coiled-coil domain-containing protein [Schistosoma japonicum]|nr:Coiled-coil domain-containing protein [Schistosoma japonicum]
MEHSLKVQTRNSEFCFSTPPYRSEVSHSNYQRRCLQKQLEGLYAPTNQAYKELGQPLLIDAQALVKSVLGHIPQRPNMLYGYESKEYTGDIEFESDYEELQKDNLNAIKLTSESVEKSCQSLRPKQVGINEKSTVYHQVQSGSAYMERRRKRGIRKTRKKLFWHAQSRNNTKDESVEKKTDDIDEDEVLNEEPEIYELMNNLISAGCDLKLPLTDKQQYSNDMKQSHDYVISSIEHQRCRRYKQWEMELQRPFTPKYFNICKPDFDVKEMKSEHVLDSSSCKQMKMKPRNQNFGSTNSLNSLQSGTLSSEQRSTTPISSMRKSQSIKNLSKSKSSNQLLQFIEHCNDSLLINQKSFNQSMNITNTTATIRKSVQFLRKTNPMKQNEKPFSESHVVKESSKELTSNKFSSLVDNIHKQISMAIDEKAIELQDLKPEICLTKYHNIPVDKYTHVAMQCMQRMSLYNKATGELAKKSTKKKQLATWYLDILTDLSDLKSSRKFTQLSPSLFTVLSFTRVLCSLTLWEILSPTIAAAIDFVRMRVVDMSTEEYLDWLCQFHFIRVNIMNIHCIK